MRSMYANHGVTAPARAQLLNVPGATPGNDPPFLRIVARSSQRAAVVAKVRSGAARRCGGHFSRARTPVRRADTPGPAR